jgi:hypothetical protein
MSGDQSVSLKHFQMEEHPSARNAPSPTKSHTEYPECSPSGNVYQGFEADILEGMEYSDNEDHPQNEHMEDHHKRQGDGKIIPPGMGYATPSTSVSPRGIGGVTGVIKNAAALGGLAAAHVVNEAFVRPLSPASANVIGSVIGHLPLQTVTSPPHGTTYHIPNSPGETIPTFGVTPGRPTHNNYVNYQNNSLYFNEMQETAQRLAYAQNQLEVEKAEKDRLAKEYLEQGERLLKLDNHMTYMKNDQLDYKRQCDALKATLYEQQTSHEAQMAAQTAVLEQIRQELTKSRKNTPAASPAGSHKGTSSQDTWNFTNALFPKPLVKIVGGIISKVRSPRSKQTDTEDVDISPIPSQTKQYDSSYLHNAVAKIQSNEEQPSAPPSPGMDRTKIQTQVVRQRPAPAPVTKPVPNDPTQTRVDPITSFQDTCVGFPVHQPDCGYNKYTGPDKTHLHKFKPTRDHDPLERTLEREVTLERTLERADTPNDRIRSHRVAAHQQTGLAGTYPSTQRPGYSRPNNLQSPATVQNSVQIKTRRVLPTHQLTTAQVNLPVRNASTPIPATEYINPLHQPYDENMCVTPPSNGPTPFIQRNPGQLFKTEEYKDMSRVKPEGSLTPGSDEHIPLVPKTDQVSKHRVESVASCNQGHSNSHKTKPGHTRSRQGHSRSRNKHSKSKKPNHGHSNHERSRQGHSCSGRTNSTSQSTRLKYEELKKKYRLIASKESDNPSSSSSSSSHSDTSYNTKTSYLTTTTHTHTTNRTDRSKRRQDQSAVEQLAPALQELAKAISSQVQDKAHPVEKFKMNNYFQLKQVRISKGERITTPFILKTLSNVKTIDSAASKASNRKPQTANEWHTYLKFHLAHLEDSLHEEMSAYCQENDFHNAADFWTQVYKKVFPSDIALDAFDKALTSYMIWSEPLGFERWQAITNIMLTHKAHMKGKLPTEVPIYIAEGISQQLQRVVRACPEQQSATLFKDYTSTYSDILNARELCHPVTKEMYTTSNQMFIRQLKRLLDSYTSESIFGHSTSKEHKASDATPKVQQITREVPSSTPAEASPPPTYTQVTQLGGQGYQGRPAPKDRKPVPPGHQSIAPTGLVRTWNWYTVTNPNDKVKHPIRIPCYDPPPKECTNSKCVYYGDWLDVQGVCSYCLSDKHLKSACEKYRLAVAKYTPAAASPARNHVANTPAVASTSQGNQ